MVMKPFICRICPKSYQNKSSLKDHMVAKHDQIRNQLPSPEETEEIRRERAEGRKLSQRRYYLRIMKPKQYRRIIAAKFMKPAIFNIIREKLTQELQIFAHERPRNGRPSVTQVTAGMIFENRVNRIIKNVLLINENELDDRMRRFDSETNSQQSKSRSESDDHDDINIS